MSSAKHAYILAKAVDLAFDPVDPLSQIPVSFVVLLDLTPQEPDQKTEKQCNDAAQTGRDERECLRGHRIIVARRKDMSCRRMNYRAPASGRL